jgi:ATP-dependent helicase/nuclease subunit A
VPINAPAVPRRTARRPSGETGGTVAASRLFAFKQSGAAEFGREVHACLAEVEWGSAASIDAWALSWVEKGLAGAEAVACLRAEELRHLWACPAAGAEVWREREFEIVLEGDWVTGVFDRVVVERDGRGRVVRATVYDFKTDGLEAPTEVAAAMNRHAGQVNLYRRVMARLAGLALSEVRCELVFTRLRRSAVVVLE